MPDIFWLLLFSVVYLAAALPFLKIPCHQDAGWHSYWAWFRHRGVGLDQQLNIMMGCTRLGPKILYVAWHSLFRERDPDRLTRKIALFVNLVMALGIYSILARYGAPLPMAGAGLFLLVSSIPTLGLHYETAERTANFFGVIIFALAVQYLVVPSNILLGGIVFLMFASATLFKITQLVEYFAIWILLFFSGPGIVPFMASLIGGVAGVGLFILILHRLNLLKSENLGVFGYALGFRPGAGNAEAEKSDLSSGRHRQLLISLLSRDAAVGLGQKIVNFTTFVPPIMGSVRALLLLSVIGATVTENPLRNIALAWAVGGSVSLVIQGRFLPFHFIPLIVPVSILAGFGFVALWTGEPHMENAVRFFLIAAAALLVFLDIRYLVFLNKGEPLDIKFLPKTIHPVFRKNRVVYDVANYVEGHSNPDDYLLVWGALPQLNVLSGRRSPINWLSTNKRQMDPILPNWKDILVERCKTVRPAYLFQVDDDLDLSWFEEKTGLGYSLEESFGNGHYKLFRLSSPV